MERRSGKYFGAGTALGQISLATGGTLTLKRSANHVVLVRLTLDQFIFWPKLPPNAGFGIKNLKKNSGVTLPDLPQREGATPSRTNPHNGYTPCVGRKLPRCWDLGLGNRSPKSKFTTTPLLTTTAYITRQLSRARRCGVIMPVWSVGTRQWRYEGAWK